LLLGHDAELERELILTIGAMSLDSFGKRLERYPREKLAVVVGDRSDIQNLAIREGVQVLIVTGGLGVEKEILEAAQKNKVNLISSPHDTATTAALCRASIAIRHMVNEEFLTLNEDASLEEVRARATASGFAAFPVLDAQRRTVGVLSKTDFLKTVERKLILVDHNELSQAVQGADQVEILEIIDHHRIGTLTTQQPILFRNEPVGSTSTIVAECFFRYGVELPSPIAGLLLAGIIADTLNLTSPTTTAVDGEMLRRLEQNCGMKARDFTEKLFASGSLLTHKPAPKAITTDCKEYQENGVRFSVAQIEELGFDQFWKRKVELQTALEAFCNSRKYQFSALLVTDVNRQSSLLLMVGDSELIENIKYPRIEPGIFELKDIVSRKKQLLPYLTHSLKQFRR
jgi:manganese-dependent inorganic pyrophosphatase